jgi:CheY-like chemotaxis protein
VSQKQAFAIRAGKIVVLSVIDEGCGMAEPVRSRVFEPFFTTKTVGEGSGLGLAAVHGTMLSHGGGITVESELGVGSSFHLYFPVATNTVVTRMPSSGVGFSPQLLGTVLVVDDEPLVLRVTRRYLRALGATAIFATDGVMALEMLESGEPIHCVLTDVVMPKMNGSTLIAEIRRRRPGLPVVVMSGFPAGSDGLAQQVPADCPWLRKPFGQLELAKLLLPYLNGSSETEATNHET